MITKLNIDQWEDLPLEQFKKEVFQLQRRIFGSSQQGNRKQTHRLQKLLLSSFAARCVAVQKVAEIKNLLLSLIIIYSPDNIIIAGLNLSSSPTINAIDGKTKLSL